jgi:hypothetical protein
MNQRWAILVAASLVVFSSLVITWQIRHRDDLQESFSSLWSALIRGEKLSEIPDIVGRELATRPFAAAARNLDLRLPDDVRLFMTDMTGPTNYDRIGFYFYLTYYLFPREIAVSIDRPTCQTSEGFQGTTTESSQVMLANGYDVRIDITGENAGATPLRDLPLKAYRNPVWFDSATDVLMAFLLPLLTAWAGTGLVRGLFPALYGQMPIGQRLAYGLGLGMMFVAALTLGMKLCGFHGRGVAFVVTAIGAMAGLWRSRRDLFARLNESCRRICDSPVLAVLLISGLITFLILFRLAALEGLMDGDAMRWMLKAKIIHLFSGKELVQWFSNPRLTHTHLDYPTLVPSLHAATYDSIGHVNDWVVKFWPAWILLFLVISLASLNLAFNHWQSVWWFGLLGFLLLPVTQQYVQWEGSTMPMVFFIVLGFIACARWLIGRDRAWLGLGLTLLWGGVMTRIEGFVLLALAGGWMLLLPRARPRLRPSPVFWWGLAFCFLAALPYVYLRLQIPAMHYESGWADYARYDLGSLLSVWPRIILIQIARLFLNADFANWSRSEGTAEWIGKWDGMSSLYNPSTMGLPWLCLLLTLVLWFAMPSRRPAVTWMLAMLVAFTAVLTGAFASFSSIKGADESISYTLVGDRYFLPVLFAWFATSMAVFFAEPPFPATSPGSASGTGNAAGSAPARCGGLPALAGARWLAVGALCIIIGGVFVLSGNDSASLGDRFFVSTTANSPNATGNNSPQNVDMRVRMEAAIQLDTAGKSAEAQQAYRDIIRLYPDNPVALNNLAWSLATNPRLDLRNGKEAVRLATRAVKLTGQRQSICFGTLAAAYAQEGYFAKAIETAQLARSLALKYGPPEQAAKCEEYIKLYTAGKAIGMTNAP